MSRFLFLFGFFAATFSISSCGGGKEEVSQEATTPPLDSSEVNELTQFKYDKLISNVPIPFDILRSHSDVPLTFVAEAVNPPSNLPFYSSSHSKALNLGIYGGDLAYCITYEKFEDMGKYLKCAKKLADDLGIPLAFDQRALTSYKNFNTNKDSLEKLVFASYSEVDATLKSNERIGLAALVVTGGWLEGLHTTLKTLGKTERNDKTKGLYKKVWEQKNHVEMIIGLLEEFKEEITYVNLVMDLHGIKSVYDNLSVKTDINEAEIQVLGQKVEEIRNKIVSR